MGTKGRDDGNGNDGFGQDFDFGTIGLGDEESDKSVSNAPEDNPFGDDDVFPTSFGGGDEDNSESTGASEFDDGQGDGFSFVSMPDPTASGAAFGDGDDNDEFADVSGNGDDSEAVWDGEGDLEDEDSSSFSDDSEDGEVDFKEDENDTEDDGFSFDENETEDDDDELSAQTPSPAGNGGIRRLIFPIAAAAVLGVVVYGGYSVLSPILFGGGEPPPQVVAGGTDTPSAPSFPADLPGVSGASTPSGPSAPMLPDRTPPQAPSVELPASLSSRAPDPQVADPAPGTLPQAATPSSLPPAPGAGGLTLPELPAPAGDAVRTATIPLEEELAGGPSRGGIDALRPPADAGLQTALDGSALAKLEALERAIDEIRKELSEVRANVASFNERFSAAGATNLNPQAVSYVPQSLPEGALPPLKPRIIEEVSLKGVSRDMAWVSTKSGVVEVKEGDSIPGAGTVVSMRTYGGNWFLVTTDGLVIR